MGRYVVDVATSKSPDEVKRMASDYLSSEGFAQATYRGEQVWRKGKGWLSNPQFIAIRLAEDHVHLEGWVPYAPLPGVQFGEVGTPSIWVNLPIRRLIAQVEHLGELLQ
jgi:hypothetical protein